MRHPLVSIIVPCYNQERFIAAALDSLLAQTYPNWEAIIVNDGSTDLSEQIVLDYCRTDSRFVLISQPNKGLSGARNTGITSAKGAYVGFLDADDAYLPDKLARQVEFLEATAEVDVVYGDYFRGDSKLVPYTLVSQPLPTIALSEALIYRNWFDVNSPLLRRSIVDEVGPFDEVLKSAEDWDYWIRVAASGQVAYCSGPVAIYRTHDNQMHKDTARMRAECLKVAARRYALNDNRYQRMVAAIEFYHARIAVTRRSVGVGLRLLIRALYLSKSPLFLVRAYAMQKYTRRLIPWPLEVHG